VLPWQRGVGEGRVGLVLCVECARRGDVQCRGCRIRRCRPAIVLFLLFAPPLLPVPACASAHACVAGYHAVAAAAATNRPSVQHRHVVRVVVGFWRKDVTGWRGGEAGWSNGVQSSFVPPCPPFFFFFSFSRCPSLAFRDACSRLPSAFSCYTSP
jgi:hypothetical protein